MFRDVCGILYTEDNIVAFKTKLGVAAVKHRALTVTIMSFTNHLAPLESVYLAPT